MAIFSLYCINQLVFVIWTEHVSCVVAIAFLNFKKFVLQTVNERIIMRLHSGPISGLSACDDLKLPPRSQHKICNISMPYISSLVHSSILKMEATDFSEKLVTVYQIHGIINHLTVILKYFVVMLYLQMWVLLYIKCSFPVTNWGSQSWKFSNFV